MGTKKYVKGVKLVTLASFNTNTQLNKRKYIEYHIISEMGELDVLSAHYLPKHTLARLANCI